MWVSDMQMNQFAELYELEFVDRKDEKGIFQQIIVQQLSRCFFCIQAQDGFGKTWLLRHLCQESNQKSEPIISGIYINLEESHAKDAEELLRYLAKKVHDPIQQELTNAVTTISTGVSIQTQGDVNINGDVIGGHQINVPEIHGQDKLNVVVSDPKSYIRNVSNLQDALSAGLCHLQPHEKLVLFLDNFGENTTESTRKWLLEWLAPKLQRREILNLIVVIASNEPYQCFEKRDWKSVVAEHRMGGIPDEFIREYWLEKRQLDEVHLETIIPWLNSKDNSPTEMSSFADIIEQSKS